MPPALSPSELPALLAAGHPVVLAQPHASRLLRAQLSSLPGPTGNEAVLAWNEWTATLWSSLLLEGLDDRLLLNRLQEEHLWQEIIAGHSASPTPTAASLAELAKLARSGLQLAAAHSALGRLATAADTSDARTFNIWLDHFRELCQRRRLLAPALLENTLTQHLRSSVLRPPPELHLLDLAQPSPAQTSLLQALEVAGTRVLQHTLQHPESPTSPRIALIARDTHEELRLAVRLIAQHARQGTADTASPPRIALLAPDPAALRPELERLFRELLAPELDAITADLSSTPWEWSSRPPLSSLPVIADALDLLRWTHTSLSLERIGHLLLSPFFEHTDPLEVRARFELRALRRTHLFRPTLTLPEFLLHLRRQSPATNERQVSFPALHTLSREAAKVDLERAPRSHADWTDRIRHLLRAAGWPGSRTLSPAEFRATSSWEDLLDTVATLGFSGARLSFPALLDILLAESRHRTAPAGNLNAPLQVLSLDEAEGLTFDLTLLLGASDDNLPIENRRHPLLPQALQRSLGIGDIQIALERTRHLLHGIANRSATTLLLASPAGKDNEVRLSPLAGQIGFSQHEVSTLLPAELPPAPVLLERVRETHALPCLPAGDVSGGADVLRLQAACGFRAFATHRLAGEEPRSRNFGLDARQTGSLLHAVLEHLWKDLGSQAALRSLSNADRHQRVSQAVEAHLARLRPLAPDSWSRHYLGVLEQRLVVLLKRWLDLELQRSPFTVLAQEQKQILTLGPVRLSLRPDRIDQTENGLVYVDYKTTYELKTSHWLDDRPDAPQLPAYALAATPETFAGIAFAQIRPGSKMGWISLSSTPGAFPAKGDNKVLDAETQLDLWRAELTALADAFAAGDARVDPKDYPKTCQYCAYRALCRLDPATLRNGITDEDELPETEAVFG